MHISHIRSKAVCLLQFLKNLPPFNDDSQQIEEKQQISTGNHSKSSHTHNKIGEFCKGAKVSDNDQEWVPREHLGMPDDQTDHQHSELLQLQSTSLPSQPVIFIIKEMLLKPSLEQIIMLTSTGILTYAAWFGMRI